MERQVPALIAPPGQLRTSLLGMSFLSRLQGWEVRGDKVTMRGGRRRLQMPKPIRRESRMLRSDKGTCSGPHGKVEVTHELHHPHRTNIAGGSVRVFAYWYQREEALFRSASPRWHSTTMFGHGAFGLFFGISFAILGMLFFPPVTETIALVASIYILFRALDNIDHERSARRRPTSNAEPKATQ